MQRASPVLIMLLLIGSCVPMGFVVASGESSTINTFTGGFATVDVTLQGGVMNNATTVDVPRNVTFTTVSFDVDVDSTDQSPGQVWIDIDEDGIFEWEYTGTGYGNIGHQNQFYDGNDWYVSQVTSGTSSAPGIMLPSSATLQSSNLNASFSSQAGGGFYAIGAYQEVIETDIDTDGNPEPMFLSNIQSNYSTSIVWADWTMGSGITTSTPIQTCDNATSISVGDVNGDGDNDIVTFSTTSGNACIHLANGTSFDPVQNSTVTNSGLVSAKLGDINSDGMADVISIDSLGTLAYQSWNNTTSGLVTGANVSINPNGSNGIPANLVALHVGDFFGNSGTSALVMDQTGHWTLWQDFSGMWGGPITRFDDIKQDEILTDLDGDGDIDLVGLNDQGYAFRINDGSKWDLTSFQSQIFMHNSTIADFDNDGDLDLMIPVPGTADGVTSTVEGNITLRDINASNISSSISPLVLEPWSIPKSIVTMDMDGDGVVEQVVSAGETTLGVFIGGWHSIELDGDGDGFTEMSRSGYAGDSSNGLDPLTMFDDMNGIRDDLSPLIANEPSVVDAYGISMVNYSMNVKSTGDGEFNFTSMDIGYDCSFFVSPNPHASSNLTNVFNQGMTAGVGNYAVSLPVNSSQAGNISLTNIIAIHVPGAPNLSLPITPTLTLSSATPEQVVLAWNDPIDFGLDFVEFEIFRLESANETVALIDVYNSTRDNQTIDLNVSVGSTYWYIVRSVHTFGITSNLSNVLQVTIPYPSPPAAISGIELKDVDGDQGGVLQLSWNHSQDDFSFYEVYLELSQFSSISGLTPVTNISSTLNSTILSGLVDGQEYWAAVVAVNQFGNKTSAVISVGPTYPRNDVPSTVNLQLTTSSQTSIGLPFSLEVTAEVDGIQTTPSGTIMVSMETSSGTYPIANDWNAISLSDFANLVSFASNISGEVTFWANYSGDVGDEQTRPVAAASTSASTFVTVGANLTSSESIYELDWENETNVRVDLEALNSEQQSMLEGTTLTWTAYNSTTNATNTGTEIITNGFAQFFVTFSEEGTLFINSTSPNWLEVNSLEIPLVLYGSLANNSTGDNGTVTTPWTPDVMLDATLDCGDVIIDPSINQKIDCTISNPNNYTIDISLEEDGWSQWSAYILFEPTAGQSEFTLTESESKTVEIQVNILQNLSENGLTFGLIHIDLRQGPTDYSSPADRPLTFDIQWTLITEDPVIEPEPSDNNTNQTTNNPDDTSSENTMLILGGVGGLALIGLVVFIVLRIRNSDLEDWDEDDLDLEPDVEFTERTSKPLPVGVALDEFEDKTIVDDSPDKPDFINEFDEEEEPEEEPEEGEEYEDDDEPEEEYEDSEEDDSGITVDEHGTEWYEDEIGVWWYRDPGEDDWSEYVE